MYELNRTYFCCDECPIVEGWFHRLALAEEFKEEPQIDHCGCEKIGYQFFIGGYCGDAFEDKPVPTAVSTHPIGRAQRRKMTRRKLKKEMEMSEYTRSPFTPYKNRKYIDGEYVIVGDHLVRFKGSSNKKFWKRHANKAVRRNRDLPAKGSGAHKAFDLWWELT